MKKHYLLLLVCLLGANTINLSLSAGSESLPSLSRVNTQPALVRCDTKGHCLTCGSFRDAVFNLHATCIQKKLPGITHDQVNQALFQLNYKTFNALLYVGWRCLQRDTRAFECLAVLIDDTRIRFDLIEPSMKCSILRFLVDPISHGAGEDLDDEANDFYCDAYVASDPDSNDLYLDEDDWQRDFWCYGQFCLDRNFLRRDFVRSLPRHRTTLTDRFFARLLQDGRMSAAILNKRDSDRKTLLSECIANARMDAPESWAKVGMLIADSRVIMTAHDVRCMLSRCPVRSIRSAIEQRCYREGGHLLATLQEYHQALEAFYSNRMQQLERTLAGAPSRALRS